MCTTFSLKREEHITLGQSYDFYYGHGLVIANKKGIKKIALCEGLTPENIYDENVKAPRWVSKYGSITFNQFGREIPTCGVNEKGLSVTSMWHDTDNLPGTREENSITELQWIQYQLDCYSDVKELLENLDVPGLRTEIYPMHYTVCDKSGHSAIIEIKDGKLTAYNSMENYACSNAGIIQSIEHSKQYYNRKPESIRINQPILDRAAKALLMTKQFNESSDFNEPIEYSFKVLDAVSLQVGFKALFKWLGKGIPPSQTFWQIVFDLKNMKIYFKTKENRNIRIIDVLAFDYSSGSEVKVFDVNDGADADVTCQFHNYLRSDNERIVRTSFKPLQGTFSNEEQEGIIIYPELLVAANVCGREHR